MQMWLVLLAMTKTNDAQFGLLFFFLQMEGIPSKVRSLKMNLMLGKLYRISRNIRAAAICYKECLRYTYQRIIFYAHGFYTRQSF